MDRTEYLASNERRDTNEHEKQTHRHALYMNEKNKKQILRKIVYNTNGIVGLEMKE